MAGIYKQLVTRTYTGDRGGHGDERPEFVEIDEDTDILACRETFDRSAAHVKPLKLLRIDLPGDATTRRIPVLENDDVRIELLASGDSAETGYARSDGWHEVHIQIDATSSSRTGSGEFAMGPADLLVVPAGVSHHSVSDAPMARLIMATRRPLKVADGYPLAGTTAADSAERCLFLQPEAAANAADEGVAGGKHFELVVNDDILIETTFRSDDQRIYHLGYDQDEVHFQLSGRRATRTVQGEFVLETGDMLLIPPGVAHRNIGGMPTIRIVLYARHPLRVAEEYRTRLDAAWGN